MEEHTRRIVNRIYGLAAITFGVAIALGGKTPFLELTGGVFLTEGAGDIISGEHHYLSVRLMEYAESKIKQYKNRK